MERRSTVGIVVFDDKILHFLGIHERCREGVLLCLDIVIILKAVGSQHLLHLLVGAGSDLVDHRPREGDLRLILQIVEEGSRNQSVVHPAFSIGKDTGFHLIAVVRTVVHRLDGKGQQSGIEAFVQQCCNLTHGEDRLHAASQVGLVEGIAFLRDGEGDHLQRGVLEDFHKTVPVVKLIISL